MSKTELKIIPVNQILANFSQPREVFDRAKIKELAESILSNDLINPIIVRKWKNGKYMIVSGERRWQAHKIAGLKNIQAFVKEYKNEGQMMIDSLIENLQREDLTSIERENYIYTIWKTGMFKSYAELAKKIGYTTNDSRSFVSDLISAKEERDRLKKVGIRTAGINTEIIKKAKSLDDRSRKGFIKDIHIGRETQEFFEKEESSQ